MKVLVVDDKPARLNPLLEGLRVAGIDREEVTIAQSGMDAERLLSETQYDLLVLDILLPYRPEDAAKNETSLSIIEQITSLEILIRPRYILGISAYDESEAAALETFKSQTWAIVRYSASSLAWVDQIINAAKFIRHSDQGASREYASDVAIVTALRDPELGAVLSNGWNWSNPEPLDDNIFAHSASVPTSGRALQVHAAHTPRMGMVSTALLAAKLIEKLRPRLLLMCGICAGVKGKVELGDVIFADPSWDYQSGKRVRDSGDASQFSIAPHQLDVSASIRARGFQLGADRELKRSIRDAWEGDGPRAFEIHVGPLASGSAVLADGDAVMEIRRQQQRDLLGIEMEAYGLYAAARQAGRPAPAAIAIKAVCDFADPDKKDEMQRFAAYASASVATEFVERFSADLVSGQLSF